MAYSEGPIVRGSPATTGWPATLGRDAGVEKCIQWAGIMSGKISIQKEPGYLDTENGSLSASG